MKSLKSVAGFRRRTLCLSLALSSVAGAIGEQASGRRWDCSGLGHVARRCFGTVHTVQWSAGGTEYPRLWHRQWGRQQFCSLNWSFFKVDKYAMFSFGKWFSFGGLASDSDKFKIITTLRRAQKFGDTGPYKHLISMEVRAIEETGTWKRNPGMTSEYGLEKEATAYKESEDFHKEPLYWYLNFLYQAGSLEGISCRPVRRQEIRTWFGGICRIRAVTSVRPPRIFPLITLKKQCAYIWAIAGVEKYVFEWILFQ